MEANRPKRIKIDAAEVASSAATIGGIGLTALGGVNGNAKMMIAGVAVAGLNIAVDRISNRPVTGVIIDETVNDSPDILR